MYYKLSKDNCGECVKLKMMMSISKFDGVEDKVISVHKEDNPEEYTRLTNIAAKQNFSSLPIIMTDEEVLLSGFDPTKASKVLEGILND